MSDINKTTRIALRKLIKQVRYWSDIEYCEKGCTCDACKAIRYGIREVKKLTYIIETNKRARAMYRR